MTAPAPTDRPTARGRWQLRDIVLLVVLGVVFGFVYWVFVQAYYGLAILLGPFADLSANVLHGSWLIVAPIAIAITRKPGAGVVAEVLAAAVEVFLLASPFGAPLLLTAVLQGVGSELAFALYRYRRFTWSVYALSGLGGGFVVFWYTALTSGWYGQDIFAVRLGIQLVSGVLLGGLLAKVVVDALLRTGVLDDFAIGRDRRRVRRS
jgi:energy-coupling factor transport system substrate-specific component